MPELATLGPFYLSQSLLLNAQSPQNAGPIFEPRTLAAFCPLWTRVGNFRQKNYSAEDGIDGTIGLFQRNSGCSTEQKRRKMLGILYHGTKIEAKSRNPVLNHSAEQKTLGIPSEPFRRGELSEFRSKACLGQKHMLYILFAGAGFL
jgi:hypothetical protein